MSPNDVATLLSIQPAVRPLALHTFLLSFGLSFWKHSGSSSSPPDERVLRLTVSQYFAIAIAVAGLAVPQTPLALADPAEVMAG